MSETLLAGSRATPEGWYADQPAPAVAQAKADAPVAPVVIDWGAVSYADTSRSGAEYGPSTLATAQTKDWRHRFVNDLGRSQAAANPNASLRVFLPVSASASIAATSRLTSR
jgi:hypothetical protein